MLDVGFCGECVDTGSASCRQTPLFSSGDILKTDRDQIHLSYVSLITSMNADWHRKRICRSGSVLQGACPCLPIPQFYDMWHFRGFLLYHTFLEMLCKDWLGRAGYATSWRPIKNAPAHQSPSYGHFRFLNVKWMGHVYHRDRSDMLESPHSNVTGSAEVYYGDQIAIFWHFTDIVCS